ncbi:MAG TPA: CDP-alcohol phosphatidyltransferase family protein [Candidatus Deferrimicrobium sp.]|nr:CDP-alcohol phosphatidyltransferase family protein [Candidatus Deferrimicrobium sp.]
MGSKFRIRRLFRPLVQWIAKQLKKIKMTPNQVSLLGIFFALGGCIFFIFFLNYWGSLLFAMFIFIAGILDGVDGALARLTKRASKRGGLLDSVGDRYADVCIIVAFLGHYSNQQIFLGIPLLLWVILAVVGVIMVSYIRARAEAGGVEDCDVGLAGRSERLFILVIFAMINLGLWGLLIVTIISHVTAFYRIYYVKKMLRTVDLD